MEHQNTHYKERGYTFCMSENEWTKFVEWRKEQDQKVIATQDEAVEGKQFAYYGCIGGGYSFTFTPTSIGTAVSVKNSATGEEINLTDYDSW